MAVNAVLQSLMNEVYEITKRPDLIGSTKQAVKTATLKMHTQDFFYKDLFETGVQFLTADYEQQLDYKTLIPLWRAAKYLRKVSFDNLQNQYIGTKFLTLIVPEQVLDSYNVERTDVFYGAGAILQIKSSTQEQFFLLGCYVYPNTTDENYNSWIATEFSPAIVYDAAATFFKQIGYDEQAAMMRQDAATHSVLIKNSNIVANGY